MKLVGAFILLAGSAQAQLVGKATAEEHLKMPIQTCTKAGGCTFEPSSIVLDSNWRWLHKEGCVNSSKCNCFLGNVWVNKTCSTVKECTAMCALDGEDQKGYREKYGIQADGAGLINLTFVTHYQIGHNGTSQNGTNVGSRVYLLEDDNNYKMFSLLNRELTMTIDNSKLPCGLNAAVYFVEMEKDGGMASFPTNKAGAKYGTGYCDAQCPHDMKWIAGEANLLDWNGSKTDPNVGHGRTGSCCAELDIWEANKISTQMTVHACDTPGYVPCLGVTCGDNNGKKPGDPGDRFKGECDKNGCDFNPYREGAHDFYGPGPQFQLDSTQPMQIITQFITNDGTDTGYLTEMRRFYIQNNKTIYNPVPSYGPGPQGQKYDSLSDDMCEVQMNNFTDRFDVFKAKGGIRGMGEAMRRGMALVFSLWDDHDVGMIWLDATDPFPIPPGKYGAPRGTCDQKSGNYSIIEKAHADAYVLYSDVRWGEIGSTTGPSAPPPAPSCPGGSKSACIAKCDPTDPNTYLVCVKSCIQNCPIADLAKLARGNKESEKPAAKKLTLPETVLETAKSLLSPKVDECLPAGNHGCLDGKPYDFTTSFPCGSHNIFQYTDHLCCEQGRPFLSASEYCCTGSGQTGVHDYSVGKCDLATPSGCACYDEVAKKPIKELAAESLIDTSVPPEGGYLCKSRTTDTGCLNGYPYSYDTHTVCGSWLMELGSYGCCPSSIGILPFLIGTTFCCKIEGAPPGKDYSISTSQCQCHRYGC